MLSAFFLGESELPRALGKAARLINRTSRLRAVRGRQRTGSLIYCQCSCRTLEEWPCRLSSHRTGPAAASHGNGILFISQVENSSLFRASLPSTRVVCSCGFLLPCCS